MYVPLVLALLLRFFNNQNHNSISNVYRCYWLQGNALKLYTNTFGEVCCIQIYKQKDSKSYIQTFSA